MKSINVLGNLWFFPDMSMYVYYTPRFWRYDIDVVQQILNIENAWLDG